MTTSRRKFTSEEKGRIVVEMMKEEKSVSKLVSEHGIHANALSGGKRRRWKTEAVQNMKENTFLPCLRLSYVPQFSMLKLRMSYKNPNYKKWRILPWILKKMYSFNQRATINT